MFVAPIQQLLAVDGAFPSRDGGYAPKFTIAMVHSFAGLQSAFGAPVCSGQSEPVSAHPQLFSLLGNRYGGDGRMSFAYPDLRKRVAAGGDAPGQSGPDALTLTFLIAVAPGQPAPLIGTIMPFAGNFAPEGWMVADGSLVSIRHHFELFQVIGTSFGGDGTTSFALPKLSGSNPGEPMIAPLGVGAAPGRPAVSLGQSVPGPVPGLGLEFLIALDGIFPAADGDGGLPDSETYVGQIIAFAGPELPSGWARCDGSLRSPSQYRAAFAVVGTSYGGDGSSSFALPDLRGAAIAGR